MTHPRYGVGVAGLAPFDCGRVIGLLYFSEEIGLFAERAEVGHDGFGEGGADDEDEADAHVEDVEHFVIVDRAVFWSL